MTKPNHDQINTILSFLDHIDGDVSSVRDALRALLETTDVKTFGVGDVFTEHHETYGDIEFRIVHDNGDGTMIPMMTVAIPEHRFDAPEAICVCPAGIPAGAYRDALHDYYFILERPVPPNGVICYDVEKNWSIHTVSTYPGLRSEMPIETVKASVDPDDLNPDLDYTPMSEVLPADCINVKWRPILGSNNYGESALNQWINSAAPAGEWWTPKTPFDRAPDYAKEPGFLHGFRQEFLDRLVRSVQTCAENTICDGGQSYNVACVMFLPSYTQLCGGANNDVLEGTVFQAFANFGTWDADERVVRSITTGDPVWYWMRSCYPSGADYVRIVGTDGNPDSSDLAANPWNGVAAACVIRKP